MKKKNKTKLNGCYYYFYLAFPAFYLYFGIPFSIYCHYLSLFRHSLHFQIFYSFYSDINVPKFFSLVLVLLVHSVLNNNGLRLSPCLITFSIQIPQSFSSYLNLSLYRIVSVDAIALKAILRSVNVNISLFSFSILLTIKPLSLFVGLSSYPGALCFFRFGITTIVFIYVDWSFYLLFLKRDIILSCKPLFDISIARSKKM